MRVFGFLLDFLFPPKDTARVVQTLSFEEFGKLVSPQITSEGITTLLPYRHATVRAVLLEAKFHRNPKAFQLLAAVLKEYLSALSEDSRSFGECVVILIPIPLGKKRFRERGYNQVEEVARLTGTTLCSTALERVRETPPQTTRSRKERLTNIEHAFAAKTPLAPTHLYVVLDDVTTTGATMREAEKTLRKAGVENAIMLAFAH